MFTPLQIVLATPEAAEAFAFVLVRQWLLKEASSALVATAQRLQIITQKAVALTAKLENLEKE